VLGYTCRPKGQERSYADAGDGRDSDDGAVLVFLPGWEEITNLRDKLAASPIFGDEKRFRVLPLHSMVGNPLTSRLFGLGFALLLAETEQSVRQADSMIIYGFNERGSSVVSEDFSELDLPK
jgi:hypothetical protein